MSPDTLSSLFPDRPIRPLPKRRLRERLSPEVAGSIEYPPSTTEVVSLFSYSPYQLNGESVRHVNLTHGSITTSRAGEGVDYLAFPSKDTRLGNETGLSLNGGQVAARSSRGNRTGGQGRYERMHHINPHNKPPQSSNASSIEGYDSFENTSNNKKRKIPSAGELSINGIHGLNSDIDDSAKSASPTKSVTNGGYGGERSSSITLNQWALPAVYGSINQGFSGPGRGRLGRARNGRSPLRALHDVNNVWPIRGTKPAATPQADGHEGHGIISSAIANAEKLAPQGEENVSLLQRRSFASKANPASAQFTFTCDSQVPGTVQWPGRLSRPGMPPQTSETSAGISKALDNRNKGAIPKSPNPGSGQSRARARRRLDKELESAARRRRQIATENYFHNTRRDQDVWICEFCEYEQIFGGPPRVLIRDYEKKDRRKRLEEAERRRLLEKAKAKNRKGKKSGKAPSRANHSGSNPPDHAPADYLENDEAISMHHDHSHSTQIEEGHDDGLEDHHTPSASDCPHLRRDDEKVERPRTKT